MGLVHGVPEGGTVWEVPSARSAHAREARFFYECILFHSQQNKENLRIRIWLVTQTGRKQYLQLTCNETLRETDGGTPFEAIQKNAPISWRRTLDR